MKITAMATRAFTPGKGATHWRAVLRRALRRAIEIAGALALWGMMLFLALALMTYHQTDPSASTAAGGPVANWMGRSGAWAADSALTIFGPVSVLLLPLFHVFAVRLWRLAALAEGAPLPPLLGDRWWRTFGVLAFAMALLAMALSLTFTDGGGTLPASMGGISGLLGAKAVHAMAGLLPAAAQGWAVFVVGATCLVAGVVLAAKVFALDWGGLFALPFALHSRSKAIDEGEEPKPLPKILRTEVPVKEPRAETAALAPAPARGAPEISDSARAAKPADIASYLIHNALR